MMNKSQKRVKLIRARPTISILRACSAPNFSVDCSYNPRIVNLSMVKMDVLNRKEASVRLTILGN